MFILIEVCVCPYCDEVIENLKINLSHECIDLDRNNVVITLSAPCPFCSEQIVFDETFYLDD